MSKHPKVKLINCHFIGFNYVFRHLKEDVNLDDPKLGGGVISTPSAVALRDAVLFPLYRDHVKGLESEFTFKELFQMIWQKLINLIS